MSFKRWRKKSSLADGFQPKRAKRVQPQRAVMARESFLTTRLFKLPCPKKELRLDITLQCGQSFRWREAVPGKWRGVIGNQVWTLSQDDSGLVYQTHGGAAQSNGEEKTPKAKRRKTNGGAKVDGNSNCQSGGIDEAEGQRLLRDYFQLDLCLEEMYGLWSKADGNFAAVCSSFPGVRMLNQDPVENVFSFICSSNNNIKRITMLVEKLCTLYGPPLAEVDGTVWHAFPSVSALAAPGVEDTLRSNGFGYRAKYIHKSAEMIAEKGGESWLRSLKKLPYPECHAQLAGLCGVGPKVADCICLMSMGHLEAIPVDTHVFQIAARDYLPHLSGKTVTDRVYREIGDHFRSVFGEHAGWAHSVLFSADLRKFDGLKNEGKEEQKSAPKLKKKSR